MIYRNINTGLTVDTSCDISGKYWEAVTAQSPTPEPVKAQEETETTPKKRKGKKADE